MPISALPTPPSRSDSPQDFSDRADALLGALPGFVTEANAVQSDVNAKEASASSHATIATNKAAEAQASANTASTKASEAAASAVAAAAAASNAEIAFDSFDDKYLGSKAGDPATDNDGNSLLVGALYWNTTVGAVRVWNGSAWLSMAADASIVDFQQAGAGAVLRTAQDKMREFVSVLDYGADPTGILDSSASFAAAIASVSSDPATSKTIYVPAGNYTVNSTIQVNKSVSIEGEGTGTTYGTRIFCGSALNATCFDISAPSTLSNFTLVGSGISANTAESCVRIRSSSVELIDVSIFNSIVGVLIDGADPAFYLSFTRCRFESTLSAFIRLDNSSAPGVDLMMTHCRFLGDMPNRCIDFYLGLGSIIASDIQISVTGSGPTQRLVYFGTPAPLYGGAQFSNCVFESGGASVNSEAVYILGSASYPWKELHFDNCLFTASGGSSLTVGHVVGGVWTNCTFSSSSTDANIFFLPYRDSSGLSFIGCRWESLSAAPAMLADNVGVQVVFVAPHWGGSAAFFTSNQTQQIEIIGGKIGTAPAPVVIADYVNAKKNIQAFGDNYGPLQRRTITGVLSGASSSFLHSISDAPRRVVQVGAWYKGTGGEMAQLTVTAVDGGSVYVSGGGAGNKCRIHLLYTITPEENW